MTDFPKNEATLIRVRILRGNKVVRSYKVHADSLTIGSGAGCTIRVAGDTSLKAKHVSVYFDDGALALVPEPGAEVLLNGEQVDYGLPLPTDVIKTGRLTFSVGIATPGDSLTSVPPPAPSRAPVPPTSARSEPPGLFARATGSPSHTAKPQASNAPSAAVPVPPASVLAAAAAARQSLAAESPPSEDPAPLWPMTPSQSPRPSAQPAVPNRPAFLVPVARPKEADPFFNEPPTHAQTRPDLPADILASGEFEFEDSDEIPALETDESMEIEEPTSVAAWEQGLPPMQVSTVQYRGPNTQSLRTPPKVDEPRAQVAAAPRGTDEPFLDEASYFDEDDLEEQLFEEPFDLVAELMKKPMAATAGPTEPYCAAHVVRAVRNRVTQTVSVLPGQSYRSHTKELHCRLRGSKILIRTRENVIGELRRGGTMALLSDVPVKRKWRKIVLQVGDDALLRGAEGSYHIDVYRPLLVVRGSKWRFDRELIPVLIVVAMLQLFFVAGAAILGSVSKKAELVAEQEVFAEVKMTPPEMQQPEQPNKPPPKKDTLAMSEKAPAVSSKTMRRIEKRLTSGTGGSKKPPSSVNSLVDRLMGGGGGKNPDGKSLKELVSNIDAVAPSSRGGSPFGIAGAIASLPGGGINIARSGSGGDVATLSGDQVAGTGSGVATLGREKRSGAVRGKVTKMTSGSSVKGSLSKEDVARVVNSNVHMLQSCYEKGLLSDPGLAGRIAFDWTVGKDGRVKGARVRSSTLGSAKVADCMMGAIKKWRFPKPKGGDAEITFPFMFRSVAS